MKLTDYVTLGGSGLRVSPYCLGTMTFGTDWGLGRGGGRGHSGAGALYGIGRKLPGYGQLLHQRPLRSDPGAITSAKIHSSGIAW